MAARARYVLLQALCVLFLLFALPCRLWAEPAESGMKQAQVKVAFGVECEKLLVAELDEAKKEIQTAIFSITHYKIVNALASAAGRGVKVTVKYDAGQKEWEGMSDAIEKLEKKGVRCVPIKMSAEYAGMHHKFTVIDGGRVLTGSFNYSISGARSNYENLVLLISEKIAGQFSKEFEGIVDK